MNFIKKRLILSNARVLDNQIVALKIIATNKVKNLLESNSKYNKIDENIKSKISIDSADYIFGESITDNYDLICEISDKLLSIDTELANIAVSAISLLTTIIRLLEIDDGIMLNNYNAHIVLFGIYSTINVYNVNFDNFNKLCQNYIIKNQHILNFGIKEVK